MLRFRTDLCTPLFIAGLAACATATEPDEARGPAIAVQLPIALGGDQQLTHLAASTPAKQRHHYGLVLHSSSSPTGLAPTPPLALPASVDISQWAPSVANQGDTESCQSYATGYVEMGWWANRTGLTGATFAPMYLFSQLSGNCAVGAESADAMQILQDQGIDTASDFEPMQDSLMCSVKPNAVQRANASHFRISGWTRLDISASPQQAIEQALAGGRPVLVGMYVYPEFENATATDYLVGPPIAGEIVYGGHAITAFGYDANGVWIMNQWGTDWGSSGWAELSWDFINGSFGGLPNVAEALVIDGVALSCSDSNADCEAWAAESQCQENPNYMLDSCCASCATSALAYHSYAYSPLANPGSCLDVSGDHSANKTQIEEYACNGTPAQTFTELDDGNGIVALYHPHSGKCVDVYDAGTSDGSMVDLWSCNGTAAQQFNVWRNSDSTVTFYNPNADKCLDVTGADPANRTKVELFDCNDSVAQRWNATPR